MKRAPYTAFNQVRNVPIQVYVNGRAQPGRLDWEREMWVERGEDWYGMMSPGYRDRPVRVVTRTEWLNSPIVEDFRESRSLLLD